MNEVNGIGVLCYPLCALQCGNLMSCPLDEWRNSSPTVKFFSLRKLKWLMFNNDPYSFFALHFFLSNHVPPFTFPITPVIFKFYLANKQLHSIKSFLWSWWYPTYPAFYVIRKLINVFARNRHCSIPWANSIHSASSHFDSLKMGQMIFSICIKVSQDAFSEFFFFFLVMHANVLLAILPHW